MQGKNQSERKNDQDFEDDNSLVQYQFQGQLSSPKKTNPVQQNIFSNQKKHPNNYHHEDRQLFQTEHTRVMNDEPICDSPSREIIEKEVKLSTDNLHKTSDLEYEQFFQENKKLLYCLVIELLARPYPSKEQVSYLKVQIQNYANEKDPKLQNRYLRDLRGYYSQECSLDPISESQIQDQWKDFQPTLMINHCVMEFLTSFQAEDLTEDQFQRLKQFMIIEFFKKPQEQVNSQVIQVQISRIQQICITPQYQSHLVEYTTSEIAIIDEIVKLFRVLNNVVSIKQQGEIIKMLEMSLQPDETIVLKKDYSIEDYLVTLLKLIKKAIISKEFMNLQLFGSHYLNVFREHFYKFLKCKSVAKRMLLESYYIWIFQKERFNDKFGECIQSIIDTKIYFLKLQEQDIQLVQQIIQSEGAWEAIFQINSYAQKSQNQLQECTDLLYFLRNNYILSFDIEGVHGITLLNGTIGLNRKSVYPYGSDKRKRALTIVTLLRQTFGNKKSIDYVNQDNVLNVKKLGNAGNQDKMSEDVESGGTGQFVEIMTFDKCMDGVSDQQADYILNSGNWTAKNSSQTIISEFSSLQALPESQKLKSTAIVGCCALRKEKRQRNE